VLVDSHWKGHAKGVVDGLVAVKRVAEEEGRGDVAWEVYELEGCEVWWWWCGGGGGES